MLRVKKKVFLLRTCFFIIGLMLFSLGISLTIIADIGISPWDATSVGLYDRFHLTIGTWMNLQSLLLIAMGAMIKRERPKIECMITSFVMSMFVDLFMLCFADIIVHGWMQQAMTYALGVLIISAGCGTYLVAKFSPCPIDYFMMAIKDGCHTSIAKAMTICEGTGFLFALLVQGPIGIGTLLSIFIYGPLIQFFNQRSGQLYQGYCVKLPQAVHNTVDI